ncbi:MAG: hypothetical protein JO243_23495 [Solirubrobacterales bacterium]|nr:hypothetical protein [Solirubrobacterales bacterium]MBV9338864.1 hypothetical protein [Solirubrobacterales bacterium]
MATIVSLLRERVTLQVNSVDRIFLAGYVPKLQSEGMVVRFLLDRGFPIPSPAALGQIGYGYVRAIERFATGHRIPIVKFKKGESKELRAGPYLEQAEREGRFGVVMIGVAQEKTSAWRGFRQGGSDSHPHFCYRRMSLFPNHFYIYIRDREFGRAFIKTVAYAPYAIWIYLNGHEWAKRQAAKRAIGFQALDNGFRCVEDPDQLQGICETLCWRDVERFWEYRQSRLPSPLTAAERDRGYGYRLSIRQMELSDTRVFERPDHVRHWFELTLRDQLALGRPDNVQIVFARKLTTRTPGRFRTRIIDDGAEPQLQAYYKHSKVKQYLKQGRALRTETTINDPNDFGVGRTLNPTNWLALTRIGHHVNERLMAAQLAACDCAPDSTTLHQVVSPSTHDSLTAPALRFGEHRVMALLSCLCTYRHPFAGLTNKSLREPLATLIPGYSARQMTYDLRRLRRKGLIRRVPATQRYELTDHGRRIAVFFTNTYTRILNPSLTEPDPTLPDDIAQRSPLARAWRALEKALDQRITDAALKTT